MTDFLELPGEAEGRQKLARLFDMKVPPRYRKARVTDPRVYEWCAGFAEPTGRRTLYVCGPVGSGKTFEAWGAYMLVMASGLMYPPTECWQVAEWLEACRPGRDEDAFEKAQCAGLLLLDDLGAHKGTDWTNERLFSLLDSRCPAPRFSVHLA